MTQEDIRIIFVSYTKCYGETSLIILSKLTTYESREMMGTGNVIYSIKNKRSPIMLRTECLKWRFGQITSRNNYVN